MDFQEININIWRVMKCSSTTWEFHFSGTLGKKARNNLEYRDLTGPEKLKLFQYIQMSTILPTCETVPKFKSYGLIS